VKVQGTRTIASVTSCSTLSDTLVWALQSAPAHRAAPQPLKGEDRLSRHEIARIRLRVVEQLAKLLGAAIDVGVGDDPVGHEVRPVERERVGCAAILRYRTGCVKLDRRARCGRDGDSTPDR